MPFEASGVCVQTDSAALPRDFDILAALLCGLSESERYIYSTYNSAVKVVVRYFCLYLLCLCLSASVHVSLCVSATNIAALFSMFRRSIAFEQSRQDNSRRPPSNTKICMYDTAAVLRNPFIVHIQSQRNKHQ